MKGPTLPLVHLPITISQSLCTTQDIVGELLTELLDHDRHSADPGAHSMDGAASKPTTNNASADPTFSGSDQSSSGAYPTTTLTQ